MVCKAPNGNTNERGFVSSANDPSLQAKYGHLLQHHGFQGRESATTVDEIKKTMKQDIIDINVIDARCKTLQHLEART